MLGAGLLMLAACAASGDLLRPARAWFEPSNREGVLTRALSVLARSGYVVAVADRPAGLVITEPKSNRMKVRQSEWVTREVVQVCLTEGGAAIVNIDPETLTSDGKRWVPITDGEALATIARRQEKLAEEIVH